MFERQRFELRTQNVLSFTGKRNGVEDGRCASVRAATCIFLLRLGLEP
ncbi:hypothetical protein Salmuc_04443 [Salipiger mucosus DSM 16094]|uniref:Uncharacterized protein n=1 Tax=Salipiger mucosus DSM 16094 TaxID=1123237 RepID=S9RL43_9RHOB|nr:hypothetical protein Salmuc_04443 [Salipiger mucosus DSM 16094]